MVTRETLLWFVILETSPYCTHAKVVVLFGLVLLIGNCWIDVGFQFSFPLVHWDCWSPLMAIVAQWASPIPLEIAFEGRLFRIRVVCAALKEVQRHRYFRPVSAVSKLSDF